MLDTIRGEDMLPRYLFTSFLILLLLVYSSVFAAEVPKTRFIVERFDIEGENPLSQEKTQKILLPFLGEQEGLGRLEGASRALQDALHRKGYTFHRVIIPPQRATAGVIKLQILTFPIGQVTVEGNKYYSKENILASVPSLRPGWIPNTFEIARSLQIVNEHPTKNLSVIIQESKTPDHIDAKVGVRDSKPQQFFSSLANTGTTRTGDTRLSLGYQHSNLFDLDQVLTLSYTTSPGHFSDVQQYGGYYRIPLYGVGGSLSMFITHSKADQGTVGDFFLVSGKGTFYGISFDYALFPIPISGYNHRLDLGVQDRDFSNDTTFGGAPIGVEVRSVPYSIRYSGSLERSNYSGGFYVEYAKNANWGEDNTAYAYASNRLGAHNHWDVIRYGADLDYSLPKNFLLRLRLMGQWTDKPLISGERFGLGGARSVRGFEEREMSGDRGRQINIEVWTPLIAPNTRLLGFTDWGRLDLDKPIPGQVGGETISNIGMGLRWHWKTNFNLSLDVAYVTKGSEITREGDEKLHFNLFCRF